MKRSFGGILVRKYVTRGKPLGETTAVGPTQLLARLNDC